MKDTIEIECKTKGFEDAEQKVEALADAYDGMPTQMQVKAHDCTFNIYPTQNMFTSDGEEDTEQEDEACSTCETTEWKERVVQEYKFIKGKYDRLHDMLNKYEAGTLDFTPNCSLDLLKRQQKAMGEYLNVLEIRAEIEDIAITK